MEKTVEAVNKLFPIKRAKKSERHQREIGFIDIKKTYSVGGNTVKLHIRTTPSKRSALTQFEKDFQGKATSESEEKTITDLRNKLISNWDKLRKRAMPKLKENEGILFFSLDSNPQKEKAFLDLKTLWRLNPTIKKFLSLVEENTQKFVPTRGCIELAYSLQKFRFVGGFNIPTKIPLSKEVVKRLGEADVSGFQLSFKDSPLNLDRIRIRLRGGKIVIFSEFSAQIHVSNKIVREIFQFGIQASSLFVEIKNE